MALSSLNNVFNPESYAGECEAHGAFVGTRYMFAGRVMDSGCHACAKEAQEAEKAREAEDLKAKSIAYFASKAAEARRKAGIPPRFDDRTFDTFVTDTQGRAKAKAAMQALAADLKSGKPGRNVIMSGKPGTGKSHLTCSVVHELYESKTVRRLVLADLIRAIRDTWRRESEQSETKVLDFYGREVDLLIIEEVGTTAGSDDEKARVFAVLNARYENCLPTVIVTNLGKDALAAELGERVLDRLREGGGVFLPFDWESARK